MLHRHAYGDEVLTRSPCSLTSRVPREINASTWWRQRFKAFIAD